MGPRLASQGGCQGGGPGEAGRTTLDCTDSRQHRNKHRSLRQEGQDRTEQAIGMHDSVSHVRGPRNSREQEALVLFVGGQIGAGSMKQRPKGEKEGQSRKQAWSQSFSGRGLGAVWPAAPASQRAQSRAASVARGTAQAQGHRDTGLKAMSGGVLGRHRPGPGPA